MSKVKKRGRILLELLLGEHRHIIQLGEKGHVKQPQSSPLRAASHCPSASRCGSEAKLANSFKKTKIFPGVIKSVTGRGQFLTAFLERAPISTSQRGTINHRYGPPQHSLLWRPVLFRWSLEPANKHRKVSY